MYFKQRLREFRDRKDGNFAIIFALALGITILAIGIAVDLTQTVKVKSKAQDAADAAATSYLISYLTNGDKKEANSAAEETFYKNGSDGEMSLANGNRWDLKISPVKRENEELIVSVSASNQIETSFLKIFGRSNLDFMVTSEARAPIRAITTSVVADVSWSMKGTPLQSLKTASVNFGDSMFNMVPEFRSQLEMNLVPYAGSVNIQNASNQSSRLLSGWSYSPDRPGMNLSDKNIYTDRSGCHHSLRTRHTQSIQPMGNRARIQTQEYRWELRWVNPESWRQEWQCVYKNSHTANWSGCIQSSQADFTANQPPTAGSKKALPPTIATGAPHCPPESSSMRTNVKSGAQYARYVRDMDIGFATAHDLGLLWAKRQLDPDWSTFFGTSARPWNDEQYPKYLIFLSDGKARAIGYNFGEYKSRTADVISDNAQNICDDLKKKGVTIYGISYTDSSKLDTVEIVKNCASKDKHFEAGRSNIDKIFGEIAYDIKLKGIRISH